ncbi:alpha/beta fold hydrolase [Leisingera methylohalidivorans]|uniref:alpha/beta fold hydrolase n=1 Tax=Leisingera methylohalidivorans TaxID=133924 RepID=UPI000409FCD3|nr:alpha/beta hydrolase [Leisingera methylohalidivorans]
MDRIATYQSGGIEYAERAGTGPCLLLLHGIGSNAHSFAPLIPHLPQDWRVIAWNAPGYGQSAPLQGGWPVAFDYAQALLDFMDRLGLDQVMLAGHSLGALTAGAFAASFRDRVSRLLLASPALGHGMARGGPPSPAARTRISDLEALGPEAFAAARAARLVHQPEASPELVAAVQRNMAQVRMPGYGQAARMLASGRLLDDARRIAVPVDVIVGACDAVTPPEGARRVHAALRPDWRGTYTVLPDAGHALYQQDPAGFAAALVALAEPGRASGNKEVVK